MPHVKHYFHHLSRCPGRIESYRFIMEPSIFEQYSASLGFLAWWQAGSGSQHRFAGFVSEELRLKTCEEVRPHQIPPWIIWGGDVSDYMRGDVPILDSAPHTCRLEVSRIRDIAPPHIIQGQDLGVMPRHPQITKLVRRL